MSFNEFGLDPQICLALNESGYTTPTPVQAKAIPEIMAGHDVLASADTGTGKTAAFMLPALHMLANPSKGKGKGPRVLILTPTRELATQVTNAASKYGKHLKNKVRVVRILGGMPYEAQRRDLRQYVDILVATPGRLLDHHRDGKIDFSRVEYLVFDEADRMLDMGFSEDVKKITDALPKDRQTVLFSATLGHNILALSKFLTRNPKKVEIERKEKMHTSIDQFIIPVDGEKHKLRLLTHILNDKDVDQAIVFSATKRGTEELADYLYDEGISAIALNGDMRQQKRLAAIQKIRTQKVRILVATDVAARGIDIQGIKLVVNHDLPRTSEDYTHRIGRTGRAGMKGTAVTFVSRQERTRLRIMEKYLGHGIATRMIEGLEATSDFLTHEQKHGKDSGGKGKGGGSRGKRPANSRGGKRRSFSKGRR